MRHLTVYHASAQARVSHPPRTHLFSSCRYRYGTLLRSRNAFYPRILKAVGERSCRHCCSLSGSLYRRGTTIAWRAMAYTDNADW